MLVDISDIRIHEASLPELIADVKVTRHAVPKYANIVSKYAKLKWRKHVVRGYKSNMVGR